MHTEDNMQSIPIPATAQERAMRPYALTLIISTLSGGGAERVMSLIANDWADRGHAVSLLTYGAENEDHYALHSGVERIALSMPWQAGSWVQRLRNNLRCLACIRRGVGRRSPDAVVSFTHETNVRVLVALAMTGVPVVVSERVNPRRHSAGRVWDLLRRIMYRRAACVVVQTKPVEDWALGFLPRGRVRRIPNPLRKLPSIGRDRAPNRIILAVGRLTAQKGFDILLRAFSLTGLCHYGWRLLILGDGPDRERLRSLSRSLRLSDAVSMPGIVADPTSHMAPYGIFVLSSRYEGFPNVLLEAMGMGMAVVSTDCDSGPAEIIRDGENGLLLAPEDVDALAAAILRLAADKELRNRLGGRAAEVRERFALSAVMVAWDEVVREAIDACTGTGGLPRNIRRNSRY